MWWCENALVADVPEVGLLRVPPFNVLSNVVAEQKEKSLDRIFAGSRS
jgi:hypothetical protein